ncbi:MAG: methytransferase partner Trm112 [Dehalococcoidales bacterium]|nr:methytransferase partner Trm112 [Dehalococcoidales bacterium]
MEINITVLCYNQLMKREMMKILVCPVCKGELALSIVEEQDDEIITGSLQCPQCSHVYPIEDSIPNLLPPE